MADLYPSRDSPEYARAPVRAETECAQFAKNWRGKLTEIVASPGASARLTEAVAGYEKLEDLLGRIISFAGLVYSGDTTDPTRARAKHWPTASASCWHGTTPPRLRSSRRRRSRTRW